MMHEETKNKFKCEKVWMPWVDDYVADECQICREFLNDVGHASFHYEIKETKIWTRSIHISLKILKTCFKTPF